jgi:threonine dehydrogenase-like Zn-dependent dehydrogenase
VLFPPVRRHDHPRSTACDVVAEIKRLTDGRGVDVAIEALGRQQTFESALRSNSAGGTLYFGVYSGKLVAPYEACTRAFGDQRIVTTLVPAARNGCDD